MQDERRDAHGKLQKEKIKAAELKTSLAEKRANDAEQRAAVEKQNLVALRATLTKLETQLTQLRTVNKALEKDVAKLTLFKGNFEALQEDIKLIKEQRRPEFAKEIDRLYRELDRVLGKLCCPITLLLMKEPVLASDGQVYEKTEIEN